MSIQLTARQAVLICHPKTCEVCDVPSPIIESPLPNAQVMIIDLLTLVFGISVGLLTLMSQGYVNGLLEIGISEKLALLGLGLGIGSSQT
jgi:hypothetical protein